MQPIAYTTWAVRRSCRLWFGAGSPDSKRGVLKLCAPPRFTRSLELWGMTFETDNALYDARRKRSYALLCRFRVGLASGTGFNTDCFVELFKFEFHPPASPKTLIPSPRLPSHSLFFSSLIMSSPPHLTRAILYLLPHRFSLAICLLLYQYLCPPCYVFYVPTCISQIQSHSSV